MSESESSISATPAVSVIIPTYNYGRFIRQTLQSVTSQTFDDWECIVVDDGSTDGTPDIVAQYTQTDRRFRYLAQPNRGQPAARNAGLSQARGQFVQLLDSDDLIETDKLLHQYRFLRDHPEVDIVYGSCRYFSSENPAERRYSLSEPDAPWMPCISGCGAGLIEALLERNIMVIHAPLARVDVFSAAGKLDEQLARADDWDLWLRCAVAGMKFAFRDDERSLALVRMHSTSLTRRDRRLLPSLIRMREKFAQSNCQPRLIQNNRRALEWLRQVEAFAQCLDRAGAANEPFLLIDDDRFRPELLGYPAIPFTDCNGHFGGPPIDDTHALEVLKRARQRGCSRVVIARDSAWYLTTYTALGEYLQKSAKCAECGNAAPAIIFEFSGSTQS